MVSTSTMVRLLKTIFTLRGIVMTVDNGPLEVHFPLRPRLF